MHPAFRTNTRSRLFALFGIFACFLVVNSVTFANSPSDAPVLISEPDSTRALVSVNSKRGYDSVNKVFTAGKPVRATVYLTNIIGLLDGEGATAFRAEVQDSQRRRYPLQIVSFERAPERKSVYALTIQLNPETGDVGDVLLRVTWRGMTTNRVRLSIGHQSKEMPDDEGAVPTPMPQKQPVVTTGGEQDFVALPYTGDRVRFINQATFGLNAQLEARLRRISLQTWLAEQMEQKFDANGERYSSIPYPTQVPTAQQPIPDLPLYPPNPPVGCGAACLRDNYSMFKLQNWFFREALYGEDQQLRRRVSWALSQIWVVSGRETVQPSRMLYYVKRLDKHAFGNYRDLMEEMTLDPAMGNYLDTARSTSQNPNENYAREILQLFSIGLDRLNIDGTPVLDSQGNKIPTYDQNVVNGFTKVFTGWFIGQTRQYPNDQSSIIVPNYRDPMTLNESLHDTSQKQVLVYQGGSPVIPAGQTADQDLRQALDNIFYHPNVGPFVGKLLIQQLVTSNPTPAYVERVARAFNGEAPYGRGVRGDMKSVIRAILLDPEARGNVKTDPDYGQLREPVLYATKFLRPYNPVASGGAAAFCNGQSDGIINPLTLMLDQDVFNAPTVFNYYPFDYILPGTNLNAPEFGIFTTGTVLKRLNFINQMIPPINPAVGGITAININNPNTAPYVPCGTFLNLTRLETLAQADPTGAQLVETLNKEMLNGSMSAVMRNEILSAVQAVSSTDNAKRARTALYLVATSPQYLVQR